MESRIADITRWFFWFGFVVFLTASIPHIAAYYRHFDPNTTGASDLVNWSIGYLIAIVIDVTDVLVSITVMKEMANGTPKRQLIGYWAFIVFIMALSWLINWQYNLVFGTATFAKADAQHLFGLSIGTINPIIGSAFQLLLFVYTSMAHKLTVKPIVKTAEQLKQEADDLEAMAVQTRRLNALKKTQNEEKIGGIFSTLESVKQRGLSLVKSEEKASETVAKTEVNTGPLPVQNGSQNGPEFVSETPVKPVVNDDQNDGFIEPKSDEILTLNEEQMEVLTRYPGMAQILSTGRSTASLTEISAATEIGEKVLLNRVRSKELKRTGRSEKTVYIDSVFSFLKSYKPAVKRASETGKIIELKPVRKDEQSEEEMSAM